MRRRGGFWRLFRGAARATSRNAPTSVDAALGLLVNIWTGIIAILVGSALGYETSVHLGAIGFIVGFGVGCLIAWAFNSWMKAGLKLFTAILK